MQNHLSEEKKTILLILGLLVLALCLSWLKTTRPEYSACTLNSCQMPYLAEDIESSQNLSVKDAELISINTADIKQLCQLSGVGEVIAQRIIAYREEQGLFQTPEALMMVKGIGPKKYERIKNLISVK